MAIKRRNGNECVWCFLGDMTGLTGIFNECLRYAENFLLPIKFIVEDNGVSVCSNAEETWGGSLPVPSNRDLSISIKYPHAGSGVINFSYKGCAVSSYEQTVRIS